MKFRRLAGAAGAVAATAVAGASLLFASSAAHAATTVPAQLTLSGIASAKYPAGGAEVDIQPGDTLQLGAAALAPAGSSALAALAGSVADYQVIAHFPAGFPGGPRDVTLGSKTSTLINFPNAGTYGFTWNAYQLTPTALGGVIRTPISLTSAQIQQAHIAMNAQGQWVGQVVVSDNPPAGGVGVQLPGVSIAPSLPGVSVPPIQVPGVSPTLPGLPKVPGVPGAPGGPKPNPGPSSGGQLNYNPGASSPADQVVPKGYGSGSGASYQYVAPGLDYTGGSSVSGTTGNGGSGASSSAKGHPAGSPGAAPSRSAAVDLAASSDHGIAALPSLLVIAAVLALSGATALYARTFLLRPHAAQAPVRR